MNNNTHNKLNILQLNKSHCNFSTKQDEIQAAIISNKAMISIISEANTGGESDANIIVRNNKFKGYKFEEKFIYNDILSRLTIIIDKNLPYERRRDLEDDTTPCIVIQVKISTRKSIIIVGYYRQWKLLDQTNPDSTRHPDHQMARFRRFRAIMDKVNRTGLPFIINGDINLDRVMANNPYSRGDIKDTLPLLDELIDDLNCTQINWKPTRFRAGQSPSCLDLVITNCPGKVADIEPVINLSSEHEGIKCVFADKEFTCPQQFACYRKYDKVKTGNILRMIDHSMYNHIFQLADVDHIADNIIKLFSDVIEALAPEIRFQIRNDKDDDFQKN